MSAIFNHTGKQYLELSSVALGITDSWSARAWIKPTSAIDLCFLLGRGTDGNNMPDAGLLQYDGFSNHLTARDNTIGFQEGTGTLSSGSWAEIVATLAGITGEFKVYKDKTLLFTKTVAQSQTGGGWPQFFFGGGAWNGGTSITGRYDGLLFYKGRVLSQSDINAQNLYRNAQSATSLYAALPVKANANDVSGNGNNADNIGTVTFDVTDQAPITDDPASGSTRASILAAAA